MRTTIPIAVALALITFVSAAPPAIAQTQLRLYTVGAGGGTTTTGASGAKLSIGQPVIGSAGAATIHAELGFWYPLQDLNAVGVPGEAPAFANHLYQNAPNPFNPSTTLRFSLAREEQVQMDLFDLRGYRVAKLLNETMPAGEHSLIYRAKDLSSGVYLLRLQAGEYRASRRLVLLK